MERLKLFAYGDLVVTKEEVDGSLNSDSDYDYIEFGKVVAFTQDNQIILEYGVKPNYISHIMVSPDSILTESEYKEFKEKLKSERDILDIEFEKYRSKINDKLIAASLMVQEAHDMAKFCKKNFADLGSDLKPLFDILNSAGWTTSTISCT